MRIGVFILLLTSNFICIRRKIVEQHKTWTDIQLYQVDEILLYFSTSFVGAHL